MVSKADTTFVVFVERKPKRESPVAKALWNVIVSSVNSYYFHTRTSQNVESKNIAKDANRRKKRWMPVSQTEIPSNNGKRPKANKKLKSHPKRSGGKAQHPSTDHPPAAKSEDGMTQPRIDGTKIHEDSHKFNSGNPNRLPISPEIDSRKEIEEKKDVKTSNSTPSPSKSARKRQKRREKRRSLAEKKKQASDGTLHADPTATPLQEEPEVVPKEIPYRYRIGDSLDQAMSQDVVKVEYRSGFRADRELPAEYFMHILHSKNRKRCKRTSYINTKSIPEDALTHLCDLDTSDVSGITLEMFELEKTLAELWLKRDMIINVDITPQYEEERNRRQNIKTNGPKKKGGKG